jgi:hypothetical protein
VLLVARFRQRISRRCRLPQPQPEALAVADERPRAGREAAPLAVLPAVPQRLVALVDARAMCSALYWRKLSNQWERIMDWFALLRRSRFQRCRLGNFFEFPFPRVN